MEQQEMPMGFGFALAQNPTAMQTFSHLPQAQQSAYLQRAKAVASKREMQALVQELSVQ